MEAVCESLGHSSVVKNLITQQHNLLSIQIFQLRYTASLLIMHTSNVRKLQVELDATLLKCMLLPL